MKFQNLYQTLVKIVCFECVYSKNVNKKNNLLDQYVYKSCGVLTLIFLVLGSIFFIDLVIYNAEYSLVTIEFLKLEKLLSFLNRVTFEDENTIFQARTPIRMFYIIGTLLALFCGFFLALRFYFQNFGKISKYDLHIKLIANNIIVTTLVSIVSALFIALMFWVAGYVVGILIPEKLSLNKVPFFGLIQFLILVKILSYVSISISSVFILSFPHPNKNGEKQWN